jgi:hypothetical protein
LVKWDLSILPGPSWPFLSLLFKSKNKNVIKLEKNKSEKAIWDPAYRGQKYGLVWRIERKSAELSILDFSHCSPSYLFYA